ncbi:transporter substrate-binding domain-containing protein [Thalassospira sp.]|uniref:substrate-binding periplasmic protein n=1 Tax=Thalassospira sp. TaxID=1912094 RepID=UPI0025FBDD28|nr:transporter substrate-binding domain-containing protein [Thalassospira sp.]
MPSPATARIPFRRHKTCWLSLLAAAILYAGFLVSPSSSRSHTLDMAHDHVRSTLRVTFSIWEPFAIEGRNGKQHGIDRAIMTEVAKRLDLELQPVTCPWRRCLRMLETGDIDIMTSIAYTPERAEYAHYIKPPYSRVTPVFYYNRNNPVTISDYGNLTGLTVGAVVDSRYFEPFDSDDRLEKVEANSEVLLIRMLAAQRVDAIVGSDANADYQIRRAGLGNIIAKAPYRSSNRNDIHLAVSRRSPLMDRRDYISQIMTDLHAEGFIARVHKEYWPAADLYDINPSSELN